MAAISDDALRLGLEAKIADLEGKLAHFRAALNALGGNGSASQHDVRPVAEQPKAVHRTPPLTTISYAGMGARQAVLAYYHRHGGRWAAAPEIYKELVENEWTSNSIDPLNIVRATLKRLHTDDRAYEKRPHGLQVQYRPLPNRNNVQAIDTEELTGMN